MLLVPWIQDLVTALDRGDLRREDYDLSSWRLMHSGAQPIPASLIQHWEEYFPNIGSETHYGLTESAGPCIHLGTGNLNKVGAIGRPNLNWDFRIVNDHDEDVPAGTIGELILKGNGVMKGYYKNPEATARAIVNGWLHTGDMVRLDKDDFIVFVDRKKDVIITGGENIYPVELESVIHQYPGINDVAVIGMKDERLGEIAAAIIDPLPGTKLTEEEVLEHCKKNLPNYQRPRKIIFGKVSRNPTGKLEKTRMRQTYSGG
jgi:acyl-CoA synthetase (AMP-forming)/AMP-acid ligase II